MAKKWSQSWPLVAHVAVSDTILREVLAHELREIGFTAVGAPDGYHLLQSLSDALCSNAPRNNVGLIVVDAVSRGCCGTTIAAGLRELGWNGPIVLLADDPSDTDIPDVHTATPRLAPILVAQLGRYTIGRMRGENSVIDSLQPSSGSLKPQGAGLH